jgi:hypothetical protein
VLVLRELLGQQQLAGLVSGQRSAVSGSCFSDAQSIPATLPVIDLFFPLSVDARPCPDQEVPLRVLINKALHNRRLRPGRRSRHLTTVEDGRTFHWPPAKGQAIEASPRHRSRRPYGRRRAVVGPTLEIDALSR